jgi:hypothetical protein
MTDDIPKYDLLELFTRMDDFMNAAKFETNGDRLRANLPELVDEDRHKLVESVIMYIHYKGTHDELLDGLVDLFLSGVMAGRELERWSTAQCARTE